MRKRETRHIEQNQNQAKNLNRQKNLKNNKKFQPDLKKRKTTQTKKKKNSKTRFSQFSWWSQLCGSVQAGFQECAAPSKLAAGFVLGTGRPWPLDVGWAGLLRPPLTRPRLLRAALQSSPAAVASLVEGPRAAPRSRTSSWVSHLKLFFPAGTWQGCPCPTTGQGAGLLAPLGRVSH